MRPWPRRATRALATLAALGVLLGAAAHAARAQTDTAHGVDATGQEPLRLRIVGSLGQLNVYTRHERPFWTEVLPRVSDGRLAADIVAFDQAGLGGSDMLRLVQAAQPHPATILDLGCGDGILGQALLNQHPGVTAVHLTMRHQASRLPRIQVVRRLRRQASLN